MRSSRLLVLAALALGVLGCDSAFSADDVYEDNLTIAQGVAGVFFVASDIAGEGTSPAEGANVDVFDAAALVNGALTGEPSATATTSSDGFFELQLEDASYVITRPQNRESFSSITVVGSVIRCDHSTSEEGVSWDCR